METIPKQILGMETIWSPPSWSEIIGLPSIQMSRSANLCMSAHRAGLKLTQPARLIWRRSHVGGGTIQAHAPFRAIMANFLIILFAKVARSSRLKFIRREI